MPFGLTNALADFQHFINDALHPFLDLFYMAYLNDILIYSTTLEEYRKYVHRVLKALSRMGLHLKLEKCHFHKTEVKYLGLIISADGIQMDLEKVRAVLEWGLPRNLHDICTFLGFTNVYRRFILGYSNMVVLLVGLTKKSIYFEWGEDCEAAF